MFGKQNKVVSLQRKHKKITGINQQNGAIRRGWGVKPMDTPLFK